jgi:hypothetical protein
MCRAWCLDAARGEGVIRNRPEFDGGQFQFGKAEGGMDALPGDWRGGIHRLEYRG